MENQITKFSRLSKGTDFARLDPVEQLFVRKKHDDLHFTHQELRLVCQLGLEVHSWKESSLDQIWPNISHLDSRVRKKKTFKYLAARRQEITEKIKHYNCFNAADKPKTKHPVLTMRNKEQLGLGRCPVASKQTRCCNLITLDAIEKCGFGCSYCSIQSFYYDNEVIFDTGFANKLDQLSLNPDQIYHIGTGQSSDSLMWGNKAGVLEALCRFARHHPNVILELKSKSKNIDWLLQNPVPANVICTWSLNPQIVIDHEEHLTASLEHRLHAAERLAEKGVVVGFHFHPMVYYAGWCDDYAAICSSILRRFDPTSVAMLSLGTLTFTRATIKAIRQRNLYSKILQMPLIQCGTKFSYPDSIKLDMFKHVVECMTSWREQVFFYLCMEPAHLWQSILGFDFTNNLKFEAEMKTHYMATIEHQKSIRKNN